MNVAELNEHLSVAEPTGTAWFHGADGSYVFVTGIGRSNNPEQVLLESEGTVRASPQYLSRVLDREHPDWGASYGDMDADSDVWASIDTCEKIQHVVPGSRAAMAGVKIGDVILASDT